jgi:hypothetical protein
VSGTYRMSAGSGSGSGLRPVTMPVNMMPADWSTQLAPRLFAPPARWGWQAAAPVPVAPVSPPMPAPRPQWVEAPRPDTSALVAARSKAVTRVVWRLSFLVVAAFAFTTYQLVIEQEVDRFGDSAHQVYTVVLLVVAALLTFGVIRAVAGVRFANRAIRDFEQPYLALRTAEQDRHRQAVSQWEQTMRQHAADAEAAARVAAAAANGPQWYPVRPVAEPTRVDVFGGDPRRHGWASLLVTFGSSLLAAGQRITVLDLTGQEVGDNLVTVARAAGMPTRTVRLHPAAAVNAPADVALLGGLDARDIAECLGHALTSRPEGDRREERALAIDMLRRVVGSLDAPVTLARLAAGLRVLLQGSGEDQLTGEEVGRLAAHIGDVDQSEWTNRQLRFLASQLDLLHELAPSPHGSPLWTPDAVTLIATEGGRGDRKELIDRTLVRLARAAMDGRRWVSGFLVVAGADHLGAAELQMLSEHARAASVRLLLMIDSPQGDLEKSAGTGGAVCFMKQYNHRDATIAAEFIGKEHKFVLNSLTRQVGTTFTDGGGDSFAANTGGSNNSDQRRSGTPGRPTGLSDSRGHAWTGTRSWSNADNVSTSTGSGRVYEFKVEPEQLLGMPETAFLLVDNSGQGRRVVLADCNPGLCQMDRVSAIPAP